MFKLHVIQAQFGDSLLIEFGNEKSQFILIDGGPGGVYKDSLRPELDRIIGKGGTLEALVISHVDMDHIKGVMDLLAELQGQKDNDEDYFLNVKKVWFNSFTDVIDENGELAERVNGIFSIAGAENIAMASTGIAVNGIKEGGSITRYCKILNIPMNTDAVKGFFLVNPDQKEIMFANLKFTITGPTRDNLNQLKKEWDKWLKKQEDAISNGTLDLLAMSDKSVPNLSSLTFLVEGNDKSILFTGDGRGDHLIQGLKERKMLNDGKFHVNVLKVAHHGSDRDTDRDFFERITADKYVISANGKYDNPDYETLVWIVESAKKSDRQIEIIITNKTASTNQLVNDYPEVNWGYMINFIPGNALSIEI